MVRSRAEEGSKVSLSSGRKKVDRGGPRPGHIYWASCSVRQAVLQHTKSLTGSTYPLSSAMASDLKQVCLDGTEKRTRRPCVVLRVNRPTRTALVVPMATFKGQPIAELGAHYKHFSVSVGETTPWPSADSHVLQPSPSWPLSRRKPCYAVSTPLEIAWDRIHDKYIWPVRRESELDRALQSQGTDGASEAVAPPDVLDGEEVISVFIVTADELEILQDVVDNRAMKIKRKSAQEIQAMQESYSTSSSLREP